jgi:hypothetical protein
MLGFFLLKREPDQNEKLKTMVLDNLKKVSKLSDDRKKIVAVSYVLRQFLEVKFKIAKTLTYPEMVQEVQLRDIDPYIKTHLVELFTKLPESVYKGVKLDITAEACMDLAQKTVQKFGGKDTIKRIANSAQEQKNEKK